MYHFREAVCLPIWGFYKARCLSIISNIIIRFIGNKIWGYQADLLTNQAVQLESAAGRDRAHVTTGEDCRAANYTTDPSGITTSQGNLVLSV